MSDDVDPAVSDALHRFAASAPQPRPDRLETVVAGARRRQRRVVAASTVSVVVLITACAFGVHSWRDTAGGNLVPAAPAPVSSSDGPLTSAPQSQPPASVADLATDSSSVPGSSPAAAPSPAPSASTRYTPAPVVAGGPIDPKVTFDLSTIHILGDPRFRGSVTVLNAGRVDVPAAQISIGSAFPSVQFAGAPASCSTDLGLVCPTPILRPGQKLTVSFSVYGWMPMGSGDDTISGGLNYTDSHGQSQQARMPDTDVWVTAGTASASPPDSGVPGSAPPSSPGPSDTPSSTPSQSTKTG